MVLVNSSGMVNVPVVMDRDTMCAQTQEEEAQVVHGWLSRVENADGMLGTTAMGKRRPGGTSRVVVRGD